MPLVISLMGITPFVPSRQFGLARRALASPPSGRLLLYRAWTYVPRAQAPVASALRRFTTRFGMGRGGTTTLRTHGLVAASGFEPLTFGL